MKKYIKTTVYLFCKGKQDSFSYHVCEKYKVFIKLKYVERQLTSGDDGSYIVMQLKLEDGTELGYCPLTSWRVTKLTNIENLNYNIVKFFYDYSDKNALMYLEEETRPEKTTDETLYTCFSYFTYNNTAIWTPNFYIKTKDLDTLLEIYNKNSLEKDHYIFRCNTNGKKVPQKKKIKKQFEKLHIL